MASGWSSAGPISRFIAPPLREWIDARLFRILKRQEVWSSVYECSSAKVYRKFNMRVEPAAHWIVGVGGGVVRGGGAGRGFEGGGGGGFGRPWAAD